MRSSNCTSAWLKCNARTPMTTTIPMIKVAKSGRFMKKESGFRARHCRIIRLHHQLAQASVRRIDRFRAKDELGPAGVLLHQAQSKLVILEKMGAEIVHVHSLGLGAFHQTP